MPSSSSAENQQEFPEHGPDTVEQTLSAGERLRPFLLAMVEACLVDVFLIGLADLHLAGVSSVPLPLWSPFVLIVGTLLLLHYADVWMARLTVQRQDRSAPGTALILPTPHVTTVQPPQSSALLLFLPLLVATLFLVWYNVYAQSASLLEVS